MCAVVGAPDERLGEVPWAFVVPGRRRRRHRRLDALAAAARERLAPYKIPVRFVAVAELPRNEAGKVLGRDLVLRARGAGA